MVVLVGMRRIVGIVWWMIVVVARIMLICRSKNMIGTVVVSDNIWFLR